MLGVEIDIARARVSRRLNAMAQQCAPAVAAAMADEAARIVSQMKSAVPVRSGRLKDSIGWTFGDAPKDAKFVVHSGRTKVAGQFLKVSIFAGSFVAYWARWVEFGTKARASGRYRDDRGKSRNAGSRGHRATKPQPYFWPAWKANKNHVRTAIRNAMKAAIAKAVTVN